jgi:hypothetical protein
MAPLVYALCDRDTVAETLAILLEGTCDYRPLPIGAADPAAFARLRRPALFIDARRTRHAPLPEAIARRWPGLRVLRCTLRDRRDSFAIRRRVEHALRDSQADPDLIASIANVAAPLAAKLRPRLLTMRALLTIVKHPAPPAPVLSRLRQQIAAISTLAEPYRGAAAP